MRRQEGQLPTRQKRSKTGFLDLPYEVRVLVYSLYFYSEPQNVRIMYSKCIGDGYPSTRSIRQADWRWVERSWEEPVHDQRTWIKRASAAWIGRSVSPRHCFNIIHDEDRGAPTLHQRLLGESSKAKLVTGTIRGPLALPLSCKVM